MPGDQGGERAVKGVCEGTPAPVPDPLALQITAMAGRGVIKRGDPLVIRGRNDLVQINASLGRGLVLRGLVVAGAELARGVDVARQLTSEIVRLHEGTVPTRSRNGCRQPCIRGLDGGVDVAEPLDVDPGAIDVTRSIVVGGVRVGNIGRDTVIIFRAVFNKSGRAAGRRLPGRRGGRRAGITVMSNLVHLLGQVLVVEIIVVQAADVRKLGGGPGVPGAADASYRAGGPGAGTSDTGEQ